MPLDNLMTLQFQNHLAAVCLLVLFTILLPPLSLGFLRKSKARLQNRQGASVLQPFFDLGKLLCKSETVSKETSWIFRSNTVANFVIAFFLAFLLPWLPVNVGAGVGFAGASDLFFVIYLCALARFFAVLAALDAGSAFGGFGASREVTIALLVEPAFVLCLVSLALCGKTTDLSQVFGFQSSSLTGQSALWLSCGITLFLATLVESSRMPVDDPTTHLELTMVHEAMILENSGPNLALLEYARMLKLTVWLGLSAQCLLRLSPHYLTATSAAQIAASILSLFVLLLLLALIESSFVKLRWTKIPEFVAYPIAFGLLSVLLAAGT